MKKLCGKCHWYIWEDSCFGYCHRYPPKTVVAKIFPKIKYREDRPEVWADKDFCGEFETIS